MSNAYVGSESVTDSKKRIKVEISKDLLAAYITLNISPDELGMNKRKDLIIEIMNALRKADVIFGVNYDALKGDLEVGKPFLIARGIPPVNGKDSEIKMLKVNAPKPQIVDDGSVNFYDLNLIHQIKAGDWLGERTNPVPGKPGKNVRGFNIEPIEGVPLPLHFDHESVELVREEGKDVLYSIKDGAANYVGDSIAVYNVLEINGDIDFKTGNIDFNGYVTIRGSVEENFSVRAVKDIEINGDYGIGSVDIIESLEGSIYLSGGIAGKNKAKIKCKKNLYVKYLADVDVVCEGSVYVGFYIRNSTICASQVIVDSPRGQIVGGNIDADICVECANIGNWTENKTLINIHGFNRTLLKLRQEEIAAIVLEKKALLLKLKLSLTNQNINKPSNLTNIQKIRNTLIQVQDEIKSLEAERLLISNYLRTPGEGAVIVKKRIYPKVKIVIQNASLEVEEETMSATYILKDGEIQTF